MNVPVGEWRREERVTAREREKVPEIRENKIKRNEKTHTASQELGETVRIQRREFVYCSADDNAKSTPMRSPHATLRHARS